MAAEKKKSTRATKAKMEALQAKNDKLTQDVTQLRKINASQLQRLVNQELLQIQVKELKAKLGGE
jgi:DNA repair ATPase RecN